MEQWRATLQLIRNAYEHTPEPQRTIHFLPDGRYVDAYLGCRSWRVHFTDGYGSITSLYHPVLWEDGYLGSECRCRGGGTVRRPSGRRVPVGEVPGACKDTCGVYAWRAGILPTDPGAALANWLGSDDLVHGEVKLWGDVRIHERGYKASHALLSALYVWPQMSDTTQLRTEMLAAQLEVPLVQLTIPGVEECAARGHKLSRRDQRAGVCYCACGLNVQTDEAAIDILVPD